MAQRALVVVLGLIITPRAAAPQDSRQSAEPNEQLHQLLVEIKGSASSLRSDVSTLDFFATANGGLHSTILDIYRDHIAALRHQQTRLEELRKYGSGSQQVAVDRIIPVLQEFASSAEAAIRVGQAGRDRLNDPEYRNYFKLNADLARELSTVISAWVDYAGTRGALDRASQKLAPASALP